MYALVTICLPIVRRAMRVIQGLFLAVAAAFLTLVKAVDLELVPFFESMVQGDSVVLAEHGPFTLSASCDSSAVSEKPLENTLIMISASFSFG